VNCADDLVLLDKEEAVLQGMMDRVIEIGMCCGMGMDVEKSKVMRISRRPSAIQSTMDQQQGESVECFSFLVSMITAVHDVHVKFNTGFSWQKQHSTRRRLFSPANLTSI
jgi:hypothetical protein